MIPSSQCPTEVTLIDFAKGGLNAADVAIVETHLASCGKCQSALEWIELHFLKRHNDDVAGDNFSDDEEFSGEDECSSDGEFLNDGEFSCDADSDDDVSRDDRSQDVVFCDDAGAVSISDLDDARSSGSITTHGHGVTRDGHDKSDPGFDRATLAPSALPVSWGVLGKYEVLSIAGRGGFSVVLKAIDTTLGRPVALKLLHAELAKETKPCLRFEREARAAALINHPNVITIYGRDEHAGQPLIAMEYVPGRSLSEALVRDGRFDPTTTLVHGLQIANGLVAAHAVGVIHRDIKPGNILLDRQSGRLRITDFGLARIVSEDQTLTTQGRVLGTPGYMSPEQLDGERVDFRTDLFGVGCVLYEMLTGMAPFRRSNDLLTAQQTLDKPAAPIASYGFKIPPFVSQIVEQLLEKDPDQRLPSAVDLVDQLQRALAKMVA